jgi:hypothetical protein
MWDKYRYALVAILILALVVRLSTLTLPGFIEYDNYVYYSVMLQTIAHGMTITDTLSGVPPIQFNEHPGLIYLAAVPADLLQMNPYWIMKILPPIVGVAEVLITYLIMERLTKKKSAALIAALSSNNTGDDIQESVRRMERGIVCAVADGHHGIRNAMGSRG